MKYDDFVASKELACPSVGMTGKITLPKFLHPFQRDITGWSLRRGRAAVMADCGMGKTPMQVTWAQAIAKETAGEVLILAPLAVAQQTVREGAKFGIPIGYARTPDEIMGRITITNYQRLGAFDPTRFAGIVLDESSILKNFDGATRTAVIEAFAKTPYRLACTATPAPNDFMELGNHAEFLGVMTRAEMLAMFFVHDGGSTQDWRIKGHAEEAFWRWVCSWAVMIRRPSDLGYEDGDFILPPMAMHEHVVPANHKMAHKAGMLFAMEAQTLDEQRKARRASLDARISKVAELVNASTEQWVCWGDLNDECDAIEEAIPGAVQVAGGDDDDERTDRFDGFVSGKHRVLVTKSLIAGMGMNWQHCHNMTTFGSNSFESSYQRIRRIFRFGQTETVNCHVITSELEGRAVANLERKERDAAKMAAAMLVHMKDIQQTNIRGTSRNLADYAPGTAMRVPAWLKTEAA